MSAYTALSNAVADMLAAGLKFGAIGVDRSSFLRLWGDLSALPRDLQAGVVDPPAAMVIYTYAGPIEIINLDERRATSV